MNGHGLTIQTAYYGQMCMLYEDFGSISFMTLVQPFLNGSITIGQTPLVGVGHSRSNSIVLLMLHMVCCVMAKALAL
jgi:3-isopropylmalate dehydratase small subunit